MCAKFAEFEVDRSIENKLNTVLENLFYLLDKKWRVASGSLPGSLHSLDREQGEIYNELKSLEPHASHILIQRIEKEDYYSKTHEKARHGLTTLIGSSDRIADVNYVTEWWDKEYGK